MNLEDKTWLRNVFPEFKDRTLKGEVLQAYYRAEMILNGWDKIKTRGCGCQYRAFAQQVNRQYDNWLQNNGEN